MGGTSGGFQRICPNKPISAIPSKYGANYAGIYHLGVVPNYLGHTAWVRVPLNFASLRLQTSVFSCLCGVKWAENAIAALSENRALPVIYFGHDANYAGYARMRAPLDKVVSRSLVRVLCPLTKVMFVRVFSPRFVA